MVISIMFFKKMGEAEKEYTHLKWIIPGVYF
jgi:hypothetical protein